MLSEQEPLRPLFLIFPPYFVLQQPLFREGNGHSVAGFVSSRMYWIIKGSTRNSSSKPEAE